MAERNAAVPLDRRMEFRIGINLGDVISDGGDIYGDGVNIAARLRRSPSRAASASRTRSTSTCAASSTLAFDDLGEHELKNIARPVRVYRLAAGRRRLAATVEPTEPALPDKPSIAVLPFTNMCGDPEQDYFADGMVEDIITALSRFRACSSSRATRASSTRAARSTSSRSARELGVRYVLEGSVRKAGNRVRITGQLIEAATRAHLWADRFDGALDDVFDLQDRITESVVGALQPTLRQAEIERARRKPPASLDAYDYLLRALPLLIANTAAEAATAIQLLAEALRLSPDYAYAHALMAMAYGQIFRSAGGPEREQMRLKAVAHARRAVALAGDDSTALAHAGFILLVTDQDVAAARAALDKAVALNANSASAYGYRALVLAMAGEPEPAIEDAHRALRLSPLDATNYLPQMAMMIARSDSASTTRRSPGPTRRSRAPRHAIR